MICVLFVCAGNTCRSPMAELILRHRINEAELGTAITVASAGVSANEGDPTHPETLRVLAERGIAAEAGRAHLLTVQELDRHDLIVAMDRSNVARIEALGVTSAVHLLMDFVAGSEGTDVPDPYGTDRYDEVFDLVDQAVDGLLAHIVEVHSL